MNLKSSLIGANIDAAKDLIGKAKANGQAVKQSTEKVIAELNTIVATVTPAKAKK